MRDFETEMRAVIDAETGEGPYVSRTVADTIVEKLTHNDPELLDGWLHSRAANLIWGVINERDRSMRAKARSQASGKRFAEAAAAEGEEREEKLTKFLALPFVVEDGSRKRLGSMNGADLSFAAAGYERRAKESRMNAVFLAALSKKVGDGVVSDHYSEHELAHLWNSLNR